MKTVLIKAIDPADGLVRTNEILVSRIVGWYTRHRHYVEAPSSALDAYWLPYEGGTTIISIDSGVEYEIAESLESFRGRIASLIDADESAINDANAELVWTRTIAEDIGKSPTPYDAAHLIKKRFAEHQREHCRKHHYGECSDQ